MTTLGFGFMRLPVNNDNHTDIDYKQLNKMVDLYIENGFNYFDTGYHYHDGVSEEALRKSVVERYPRDSIIIADKMPIYALPKEEDLEPIFNEQLKRCGVDYFDYYLVHNVCKYSEPSFVDVDSFGFVKEKLQQGLIKHMGISFHDIPEMLDDVLKQYPEIEFVQLQLNYYDWEDDNVKAKECYEIATKHKKPVIVMEPIKGGTLLNLSQEADLLMKEYNNDASIASWAIRYAGSPENVSVVLTGMSTIEQVKDNINSMKNFQKINEDENKIIEKVVEILKKQITIDCTKCNYCINYCPKDIDIPRLFDLYNIEMSTKPEGFSAQGQYYRTYAKKDNVGIASDCINCQKCVEKCPQHLNIPEYLTDVKKVFEIPMYGFK